MTTLLEGTSFHAVPFESEEERASLKKHFDCCAGKEAAELGLVGKKYGIPTLFVIESATQGIVTDEGVNDVMMDGVGAVTKWMQKISL